MPPPVAGVDGPVPVPFITPLAPTEGAGALIAFGDVVLVPLSGVAVTGGKAIFGVAGCGFDNVVSGVVFAGLLVPGVTTPGFRAASGVVVGLSVPLFGTAVSGVVVTPPFIELAPDGGGTGDGGVIWTGPPRVDCTLDGIRTASSS